MEDTYTLKSLQYYYELKRKFNTAYNSDWKSISYSTYVGYCTKKFNEYLKSCDNDVNKMSRQGFCDFYLSDQKFSLAYFKVLAETYRQKCMATRFFKIHTTPSMRQENANDNTYFEPTPEQCLDDIITHVIIETYAGHIYELRLCEELKKYKGLKTEPINDENMDTHLGVDVICKRDGKIVSYLQVKPNTTFIGFKNLSLIEDRKAFYKKEEEKNKYCKENNMPVIETLFVIYDDTKDDFIRENNSVKFFTLDKLADKNGLPTYFK